MELTLVEGNAASVRAAYSCACGCTPSVTYARGTDLAEDRCCCGNYFAVGPTAGVSIDSKDEFRVERREFESPWGERLAAAWLIGPSEHGPSAGHGSADHPEHATDAASTIDRVCGMTVEPQSARSIGLHLAYRGQDYFFCGKGCLLEFRDDPDQYLDAGYVPSM